MKAIFNQIKEKLEKQGLRIVDSDQNRPWGGFFVIDEEDVKPFAERYFKNLSPKQWDTGNKLSPKILMVAPEKRLSWQYHHRRAEIWRVIEGKVGVIVSDNDKETPIEQLSEGDVIKLKQGERHRLVGLDDWAVLAEIWQHTDPNNPSNEEDIVRVQDDFGR